MSPRLKRRLDAIERRLHPEERSGVVFILLKSEGPEEMDERITRWKDGEAVEGQSTAYMGKTMIGRVRLVRS